MGSWRQEKVKEAVHIEEKNITWKRKGFWVLTAFLPSSLMLGVTTFITTDIASVPLLWILPLAMYVGTFILVFSRKPILSIEKITLYFAVAMAVMLTFSITGHLINPMVLVAMHLLVFFFAAMLCHTMLAQARPKTSHLTEFYLLMSVGGALGGIFNALIAPQFFIIPIEYALILMMIITLRYASDPNQKLTKRYHAFCHHIKQKVWMPFLTYL